MGTADDPRMSALYEGHLSLDEALAQVPLNRRQRVELEVLNALIAFARPFYWMVRRIRKRPFDVAVDLDSHAAVPGPARGVRTAESDGGDYLNAEQVAAYERDE